MLDIKEIFNLITLPFLVTNHKRKILFANESCIELLNLDKSNVQNQSIDKIFKLSDLEVSDMELSIKKKKVHILKKQIQLSENEYIDLVIKIKAVRVPMEAQDGFYMECELNKENYLSEDNLVRLGNITGQIAHEISNPLSVIKIQCDNFSLKAKKQTSFTSDEVLERVKTFSKASDRIQQSNNELKNISKDLLNLELNSLKNHLDKDDPNFPQH
jgi:nitrogen-specific signal transduction histidine kinase